MKIDIDNTLIRYGRLHLTKQKGYGKDTFHAPPSNIGFYAMPIRFQELFIVGSIDKSQPEVLQIPKKFIYSDVNNNIDWDEAEKDRKKRYKKIIHKFTVKNDDLIWHHLDCKQCDIIDSHNGWVKTSVRNWKIALKKENVKLRAESMGEQMFGGGHKVTLSEVPKKGGYFTKDHFEVFIDSKIY